MTSTSKSAAWDSVYLDMRLVVVAFAFAAALNCRATPLIGITKPAVAVNALQSSSLSEKSPVDQLIPWLLDEDQQLRGVPFSEVIFDTTGKKVLSFDPTNVVDQRIARAIRAACNETVKGFNTRGSVIQNVDRINEVSRYFEDTLRELLNATPGLRCDFPLNGAGKVQRSGYPDLRIVDLDSERVFYLDPKLYATGSRDSSFRTFYFEPRKSTNKVRDDAVHFVVGFEHASHERPGSANPAWTFTRWDLVDLSRFTVKLKAEFQGSNRDMYRPEAIVATSSK
ncbi:MAG TPA: hypothetical protein VFQ78_04500 [Candidatus Udaeobacter sp.]|nr:hypothetical protein [Candidatus Udaeobacter sp.]